jgi:hypothetical protein
MSNSKSIGRLGVLVAGLGIGAALAASPGIAAADPTAVDPTAFDAAAFDPSALVADPAASIPGLNEAISIDGMTVFQSGTATAYSGPGNEAIAFGDGATADAGGTGTSAIGNYAFADGNNSEAFAGLGNYNSASAFGEGSAANAGSGSGDIAYANGTDTTANAGGLPGVDSALVAGNDSFASAVGNDSFADAGTGIAGTTTATGDIATVFGNSSDAYSGMGNFDFAQIFGNSSEAMAGYSGDNDWASVFGDMLTANAIDGSSLFDFAPTL